MTPGYFRPDQPLPTPGPESGQELDLVYTERFRRDLVELNPHLYARAVGLVLSLPYRHRNDPQRLMARDSRVITLDDDSGLRITYVTVLSLGELIVARVDYNRPPDS